nr:uncharacterized protein LOC102149743 isoform X1 [Equus caballus]
MRAPVRHFQQLGLGRIAWVPALAESGSLTSSAVREARVVLGRSLAGSPRCAGPWAHGSAPLPGWLDAWPAGGYSPAGASLLGALLSGTNSPSAPVRSSVRRRARGRKGHAWSRKTERRSRSLVEESEAGKEEKMKRCLKTMAKTAGPTQHSRQHLCSSPGSSSTVRICTSHHLVRRKEKKNPQTNL